MRLVKVIWTTLC